MKRFETRLLLGVLFILALSAFRLLQVDPRTEEIIGIGIAFILGLLGTRPMNWLKDKAGVTRGRAVLVIYLLSGIVAGVGLFLAGQFTGLELTVDSLVSFAGVYFAAATLAYQRLK